jgi:hypothetical protein
MVMVRHLLSKWEDATEKRSARNVTQSLENHGQQPQDHESTGERNQRTLRPASTRQSWIESGNQTLFQLVLFQ